MCWWIYFRGWCIGGVDDGGDESGALMGVRVKVGSGLMSYTLNLKLLYPVMRKDTIQNIFSPLGLLTLSLRLWTLGPSVLIFLNDP